MKFILFSGYWFFGFMMAVSACSALGMSINTLIALIRTPSRPKNIFIAGMYLALAIIAALLTWGGFFLAGWIGDHTDYQGQTGLLVGAVFPGIMALAIIPQFAVLALKQTAGIEVE
jgi:hypothetical protein